MSTTSREKRVAERSSRPLAAERGGAASGQDLGDRDVPAEEMGRNGTGLEADRILEDYRIAYRSRQASLIGRREVMGGRAKFGIFGDGKEVAQVAMAHAWRHGDFRSGYYRDQTLLLALGLTTLEELFAQLYAHADLAYEPATGGRAMNAHFATRLLNADGSWQPQTDGFNVASDVSPTGSQMPRLVGLAYASRLYRELPELADMNGFSVNGNEVAWGTIGNATCAEGMFWESVNAVGVLQSPMVLSIWDDEYGISVPNEIQVTKGDLSELLAGFQRAEDSREGYEILTVRGWDYPALVQVYRRAAEIGRRLHVPSIVHVTELTQPQGHSTSGSHERYKSPDRLTWEEEYDCLRQMREWMIETQVATSDELDRLEEEDRRAVEQAREIEWEAFRGPIEAERREAVQLLEAAATELDSPELRASQEKLARADTPGRRDIASALTDALLALRGSDASAARRLRSWNTELLETNQMRYSSHLYSETEEAAASVSAVPPVYSEGSDEVFGFEVVNACFDAALGRDPRVIAFGEDVGRLGDVNQGFRGLQEKYGKLRVSDTGIREATIVGQAIGLALRGLRPIAEIQYLDYLLYGLQILSDDLATLRWRTAGGQKAPAIIRTRGHRLEGIWHSGSPMAGIIHLLRGMHVLVPRDMTRAAGFYNTLLASDDPALVVEVLNGYRLRERLPDNIGEMRLPLGVPEVLREGRDVTVVTYGAMCRIALDAADALAEVGIDIEVIDVQSLLPFDVHGRIAESLRKTGRVLFTDEDVPGGTTGFMLQQVMERQHGYLWLDSEPRTLPAQAHRPAYGSDGDYFSKPSREDVIRAVYEMMHEVDPTAYPEL